MFFLKINYFCYLYFIINNLNHVVDAVSPLTPNQIECINRIHEVFPINGSRWYKKVIYQYAIAHLRFVGSDPFEVGSYTRHLIKGSIRPIAPYRLYDSVTSKIIDNAYVVMFYDKIFYYHDEGNILTPEAFCDMQDKGDFLGMKSLCLFELDQVGFKMKSLDAQSPQHLRNFKKNIVEYAYTNIVLSDFPEDEFIINHLNHIIESADTPTPSQQECIDKINGIPRVDLSQWQNIHFYQYAILYLRYAGSYPSNIVGEFSRHLTKGAIVPVAPYHLFDSLKRKYIDNKYVVQYYDKIFHSFIEGDILTPEEFCNEKDNDDFLGMKRVCVFELTQVGLTYKTHTSTAAERIIRSKMEIVMHAYTNTVLSDFPEEEFYYVGLYLRDIAEKVKIKKHVFLPESFCRRYEL